MEELLEFKNKLNSKTLYLVLFAIVSLGVYNFMWVYKRTDYIEEKLGTPFKGRFYAISAAILFGFSLIIEKIAYMSNSYPLSLLSSLLGYIAPALITIWAFKVRRALIDYAFKYQIDLKMNILYTLLFSNYYISYCINDLPRQKERSDALRNVSFNQRKEEASIDVNK